MSTETQPSKIKAALIGSGDEFTAFYGAFEEVDEVDVRVMEGEYMQAMEFSSRDPKGTLYAGPMFSLC